MTKGDLMELRGKVIEVLPNNMFRVELESNQHKVLAYSSGKIRQNKIKIIEGDSVTLEISAYDISKGRIMYRH